MLTGVHVGEKKIFRAAFVVMNSDKWRRMSQLEKETATHSGMLAQGNTRQCTHKTCLENNTRPHELKQEATAC